MEIFFYYNFVYAEIPDVLCNLMDLLPKDSVLLLTYLDSTPITETITIKKLIQDKSLNSVVRTRSISFPLTSFKDLVNKYQIFNGFDEIWLFESDSAISVPPEDIMATYEICKHDVGPIKKWMKESNCYLGLGDGIPDSLNYITNDKKIADRIEQWIVKRIDVWKKDY